MSQSGVYGASGGGGGGITSVVGGSNISVTTVAGVATVNLVNSPSVSGSLTAAMDVATTAGNFDLPATNAGLTQGVITVGGINQLNFLGDDGGGNLNVFIGTNSGNGTLTVGTAVQNVGFGCQSLQNIATGSTNTAVGFNALNGLTSGNLNNAFGLECGFSLTTGISNTMVGQQSMLFSNGSYNFVAGAYQSALNWGGAESSNICIGNPGQPGDNNIIRIGTAGTGNAQQNTCFIAGIFGQTVAPDTGTAVFVDANGQLGTVVSSERFKERISDMEDRSSRVMNLRPVNFAYKADASHAIQWGFIAEEVAKVMPELVIFDLSGMPYGVRYHDMPAILLNELQKLSKRVVELEAKLQAQAEQ
jgi:trimeric autotransporter adhesin